MSLGLIYIMIDLIIDTGDPDVWVETVVKFLKDKGLSEIKVSWFSLEVDDEISEIVPIEKLKAKLKDIMEDPMGLNGWDIQLPNKPCYITYEDSLRLRYHPDMESEMSLFKDLEE